MNLNTMTYSEKLEYIAQHGKRGTYTVEQIEAQISSILQSCAGLMTNHGIADAVIRQIQQDARDEDTAHRRSQGAKDGWEIRRGKQGDTTP